MTTTSASHNAQQSPIRPETEVQQEQGGFSFSQGDACTTATETTQESTEPWGEPDVHQVHLRNAPTPNPATPGLTLAAPGHEETGLVLGGIRNRL